MYIRQSKLKNLKVYKYSGVDHSLTSKYVLKPFYNQFIKLFPMRVPDRRQKAETRNQTAASRRRNSSGDARSL